MMRLGRSGILGLVNSLLAKKGSLQAGALAREAGISRQAAHRHLAALVEKGTLVREGSGRGAAYRASGLPLATFRYRRRGLSEDIVWKDVAPKMPRLERSTESVKRILHYSLTELVNNAIDHSKATWVEVAFPISDRLAFEVTDD